MTALWKRLLGEGTQLSGFRWVLDLVLLDANPVTQGGGSKFPDRKSHNNEVNHGTLPTIDKRDKTTQIINTSEHIQIY
ncbi:MAG: hypothetical protein ABF535_08090, partial [Acetobacter sp.]